MKGIVVRVFFVVTIVCVVILVIYVVTKDSEDKTSDSSTGVFQTNIDRNGMKLVNARLSDLERKLNHKISQEHNGNDEKGIESLAEKEEVVSEPEIEDIKKRDLARERKYFEYLKNEKKDDEWAAMTEQQAQVAFQSSDLQSIEVVSVDCKTTFCRMELVGETREILEGSISSFTQREPFSHGGVVVPMDDPNSESGHSIVYFTRDGYALPSIGKSAEEE